MKTVIIGSTSPQFHDTKGKMPRVICPFKFVIVNDGNEDYMIIFFPYETLEYHSQAVQVFMGKTGKEKVVAKGGQQMIFDSVNNIIHVFEVSKLGWPERETVTAFLKDSWPNCKISFSDQKQEPMKETPATFDVEKYNKILSGATELGFFKELQ